jgi:hypothetical protein
MKIYTALQIGEYHTNHCEDYLYWGELGNDKILFAVMDGCTTATDSYLISTIVGKLLRKIVKAKSYQELYEKNSIQLSIDQYLKSILHDLFAELRIIKNQLMLEPKEILTTLIISLIDKKTEEGVVLIVGDGLVAINGEIIEFDQENKPDYLGFHLSENFDEWYERQTQKISFHSIADISIATDGIALFSEVSRATSDEKINPITYLLIDKTHADKEEMLSIKLKKMEHIFGLKPTDDLAIIRIVNA